jgi:capsular polysaccharide biosynthesis protein
LEDLFIGCSAIDSGRGDVGGSSVDFLTVLQVARRWWKTVLALLIATVFLAISAAASVPVNYEAHGVVLLEPPVPRQVDAEGQPVAQNRLLIISGSLNVVGDILARVLNDESTVDAMRADGSADYSVTSQPQGAPLLQIEATSHSQTDAIETVQRVSEAIADELGRQQDASGVDDAALIVARPLISPEDTTALYGGKVRVVLVVLVLGVAGTLSLALLLDAISQRRRKPGPYADAPLDHGPEPDPRSGVLAAGSEGIQSNGSGVPARPTTAPWQSGSGR